jgi:hypothetical protein
MKLFRRYDFDKCKPWWMGLVRHDYLRGYSVCAPIPISTVCQLLIAAWSLLRNPGLADAPDKYRFGVTVERERIKGRLKAHGLIVDDDGIIFNSKTSTFHFNNLTNETFN